MSKLDETSSVIANNSLINQHSIQSNDAASVISVAGATLMSRILLGLRRRAFHMKPDKSNSDDNNNVDDHHLNEEAHA